MKALEGWIREPYSSCPRAVRPDEPPRDEGGRHQPPHSTLQTADSEKRTRRVSHGSAQTSRRNQQTTEAPTQQQRTRATRSDERKWSATGPAASLTRGKGVQLNSQSFGESECPLRTKQPNPRRTERKNPSKKASGA
jgi:hypothetical protein